MRGVRVWLERWQAQGQPRGASFNPPSARTDDEGRYRIGGLADEAYLLTFGLPPSRSASRRSSFACRWTGSSSACDSR